MNILHVLILAVVQGAAELLPVSSSAHVILASKLLGLDPAAPEMTFLIVMLHTGTVFAVILYFWARWKKILAASGRDFILALVVATGATGVLGLGLKHILEHYLLSHSPGASKAEIEQLFKNLPLLGSALFAVALLIIWAGKRSKPNPEAKLTVARSLQIGIVQGICLPFRGFSRSGATISTALLLGLDRELAEDFSFALAVILTPPVVLLELLRLLHHSQMAAAEGFHLSQYIGMGLVGMVFSFISGFFALKLLSRFLSESRWHFFGYYCLGLSALVLAYSFL